MSVKQVYKQYLIPPNLQKHMLRVAALSAILAENWTGKEFDKEALVVACVFHDMANIIKFKFGKPSLFKEEAAQAEYWKKVQQDTIKKYGNNVHLATFQICQEIGLPKNVLDIINKLEWDDTLKILDQQNYEVAIAIYCDMRMGPHGIMPLKDRIDNLATRNKAHDMDFIKKAATLLESTIQKYLAINLNDIVDTQLNSRFNQLLKLKI